MCINHAGESFLSARTSGSDSSHRRSYLLAPDQDIRPIRLCSLRGPDGPKRSAGCLGAKLGLRSVRSPHARGAAVTAIQDLNGRKAESGSAREMSG